MNINHKYIIGIISITSILFMFFMTGCGSKNNDKANDGYEAKNTSIENSNSSIPETVIHEVTTVKNSISSTNNGESEKDEYIMYYTDSDVSDIAKVLLRECGGVPSKTEQACVAWCVLNRVDKYEMSIYEVLRAPNQFAFDESAEIRDDLFELAKDVLQRWNDEKNGVTNSGRVLPKDYIYFHGDGVHNYFRNSFDGAYDIWDYSLDSPYDN